MYRLPQDLLYLCPAWAIYQPLAGCLGFSYQAYVQIWFDKEDTETENLHKTRLLLRPTRAYGSEKHVQLRSILPTALLKLETRAAISKMGGASSQPDRQGATYCALC